MVAGFACLLIMYSWQCKLEIWKTVYYFPVNGSRTWFHCPAFVETLELTCVLYTLYASLGFRACLHPNYTAIPMKCWYNFLWATWAAHRRKTTLPRKSDLLWLNPYCSVMMRCIVGRDYCDGHILDWLICLNIAASGVSVLSWGAQDSKILCQTLFLLRDVFVFHGSDNVVALRLYCTLHSYVHLLIFILCWCGQL